MHGIINLTRLATYIQSICAERVGNRITTSSSLIDPNNKPCNQWLQHLDLSHCNNLSWIIFGQLLVQVCPRLSSIRLKKCKHMVLSSFVEGILSKCPALKSFSYVPFGFQPSNALDLTNVAFLNGTDYLFPILSEASTEHLEKARSKQNNRSVFFKSSQLLLKNSLQRMTLSSLTSFSLTNCHFLNGFELVELAICMPNLTYLDLSDNNIPFRLFLFSIYQHNTRLEVLKLANTTNAEEFSLSYHSVPLKIFRTAKQRCEDREQLVLQEMREITKGKEKEADDDDDDEEEEEGKNGRLSVWEQRMKQAVVVDTRSSASLRELDISCCRWLKGFLTSFLPSFFLPSSVVITNILSNSNSSVLLAFFFLASSFVVNICFLILILLHTGDQIFEWIVKRCTALETLTMRHMQHHTHLGPRCHQHNPKLKLRF